MRLYRVIQGLHLCYVHTPVWTVDGWDLGGYPEPPRQRRACQRRACNANELDHPVVYRAVLRAALQMERATSVLAFDRLDLNDTKPAYYVCARTTPPGTYFSGLLPNAASMKFVGYETVLGQ